MRVGVILSISAVLAACEMTTESPEGAPKRRRTGRKTAEGEAAVASRTPRAVASLAPGAVDSEIAVARPGGHLPGNVAMQLVEVAGGFVEPIHVAAPKDGSGRIFVCERPGRIKIIDKKGKVLPEPFFDNVDNTAFQFLECGLYCIEFHPNFKSNGIFYVSYADMWFNGATLLVQYKVSEDDPNKADMKSAKVLMRFDFPYANHHGGKMAFGPDGYLYIGVGDGGWEGDVLEVGQNLGTWMGKMLRVDVLGAKEPARYAVPASNPFVKAAELKQMVLFGMSEKFFSEIKQHAKPEIWAYGIRNPWTFSFDRKTGDLYIADIGQNMWEEIDFQPADSKGGENYGWPLMCGVHSFPIENDHPITGMNLTMPVAEYKHDQDGNCVIGFGVYRGKDFQSLDGVYFLGDWVSGRVWGLKRDDGKWAMQQLLHTTLQFMSGGEDEAGNILATNGFSQYGAFVDPRNKDFPRGSVWKVVAADQVPPGSKTAPLRLQ